MTARLPGPIALSLPCYDKPGPWIDSEKQDVREWAASQCFKHCTQLEWCEQQRRETVRDHGSAVGVWAGRVYTHSDYRTDVKVRTPTGRTVALTVHHPDAA